MFAIQLNSGVPIYRQVVEQINGAIDRGQLVTSQLLPSVRVLAGELGVNPMTVSKAYSILESEGVVERQRGVGMVVVRKPKAPERVLKPILDRLVADAKEFGLLEKDLVKLVRERWKEG